MIENKIPDNKVCFSFIYFKEESVRIPGFNNFYENKLESINSVNDFFDTIREMGKYPKEVLFSPSIKKYFHLNLIEDNKSIDLIEKVLIDGYKLTQGFVDNFERTYIEFSTTNGKRVIASLMYGSLFECLFLDPNHLICPEKTRFLKKKQSFLVKSAFQKWDEEPKDLNEPMRKEYIEMAIDDYKNNKCPADETIEIISEIINDEFE